MEVFEEKEYPPKVVAMYESVIALINDGVDMNRMKVSDITGMAGIGKGTAYEYFSSKEEIIAGALVYDTRQLFLSLYRTQEKEESFERKIRVILQWIGRDFKESRTFSRLVTVGTGTYEIDHSIHEKFVNMQQECNDYLKFIDRLLETGVRQGAIPDRGSFEGRIALSSQIVSLVMYLACRDLYPDVTEEMAVETVYRNIMKLLKCEKTT